MPVSFKGDKKHVYFYKVIISLCLYDSEKLSFKYRANMENNVKGIWYHIIDETQKIIPGFSNSLNYYYSHLFKHDLHQYDQD